MHFHTQMICDEIKYAVFKNVSNNFHDQDLNSTQDMTLLAVPWKSTTSYDCTAPLTRLSPTMVSLLVVWIAIVLNFLAEPSRLIVGTSTVSYTHLRAHE